LSSLQNSEAGEFLISSEFSQYFPRFGFSGPVASIGKVVAQDGKLSAITSQMDSLLQAEGGQKSADLFKVLWMLVELGLLRRSNLPFEGLPTESLTTMLADARKELVDQQMTKKR
jgi:hypothetical protein